MIWLFTKVVANIHIICINGKIHLKTEHTPNIKLLKIPKWSIESVRFEIKTFLILNIVHKLSMNM